MGASRLDSADRRSRRPRDWRRLTEGASRAGARTAIEDDLRAGLDVARTTAVVDALTTMHDVYAQLVGYHRWSPEDYEMWLAGRLASSVILLADRDTQVPDHEGLE